MKSIIKTKTEFEVTGMIRSIENEYHRNIETGNLIVILEDYNELIIPKNLFKIFTEQHYSKGDIIKMWGNFKNNKYLVTGGTGKPIKTDLDCL